MCRLLVESRNNGQRFNIVIVAEGAKDENNNSLLPSYIKQIIVDRLDYDTRITVLGHVQRGGRPSAHDRIFSSRLGAEAANFVFRNNGPAKPIIIALQGNEIIYLPLMDTVMRTRASNEAIQKRCYTKVCQKYFFKTNNRSLFTDKIAAICKLSDLGSILFFLLILDTQTNDAKFP